MPLRNGKRSKSAKRRRESKKMLKTLVLRVVLLRRLQLNLLVKEKVMISHNWMFLS
jgi:hypothetical protein